MEGTETNTATQQPAPEAIAVEGDQSIESIAAAVVDDGKPPPIEVEGEGADEAAIEGEADAEVGVNAPHYLKLPEPDQERRPPAWFPRDKIPSGFRFPRGLDVAFIRIRGALTAAKHKGDRFIICWELADGDEKLAYGRSMADTNRAAGELAKQMVRVIDGHPVRWDGLPSPGNVDRFWQEIGAKGRTQLMRLYTQLHVYDRSEQADFFENCVGLVRTG